MAEKDAFANVANLQVIESAANTITLVFEKMAMIIVRIEYDISESAVNDLVAAGDAIETAWTTSNSLTTLNRDNAQVIDRYNPVAYINGTPGTGAIFDRPYVRDFSTFPSGGIIIPATSIYLGVHGSSMAAPITVRSTMYFIWKKLKPEEYWELVEATRALS
jgi:hypothetical protein